MTALSVTDISRSFEGVQALANVSFEVAPGERRLIIGPNGAGKTTLFNILAGSYAASSGRVVLFGRDITRLPAYARARLGLSRTFQITNLFYHLTVLENVLLALQAGNGAASPVLRLLQQDTRPAYSSRCLARTMGVRRVCQASRARHLVRTAKAVGHFAGNGYRTQGAAA